MSCAMCNYTIPFVLQIMPLYQAPTIIFSMFEQIQFFPKMNRIERCAELWKRTSANGVWRSQWRIWWSEKTGIVGCEMKRNGFLSKKLTTCIYKCDCHIKSDRVIIVRRVRRRRGGGCNKIIVEKGGVEHSRYETMHSIVIVVATAFVLYPM